MKREKRVLVGIFLISVIIISITYIIAQDLEGELATTKTAKVNVTVKASSSAPQVIFVNNISGSICREAPLGLCNTAYLDLIGGPAFSTFNFTFLAYYDGGYQALPGDIGSSDVSAYVKGNFSYQGGNARNIIKCKWINTKQDYLVAGYDVKNYSCNVTMFYYDNPQPNFWNISVQINTTNQGSGKWSAPNSSVTFKLPKIPEFDMGPLTVNWSINQISSGGSNQFSDNSINITNLGNIPIQTATTRKIQVTAYALVAEDGSGDKFGATNFTANEDTAYITTSTACGGAIFNEAAPRDVSIIVNPGLNSFKWLGFCAKTAIDVLPKAYSTTGGSQWVIDDNCAGCIA